MLLKRLPNRLIKYFSNVFILILLLYVTNFTIKKKVLKNTLMFFFSYVLANCEKCSTFKWFNKLTHVFFHEQFDNKKKTQHNI